MTADQIYKVLRYAKKRRGGVAPAGRLGTIRAQWRGGDWVFDFSDRRKGVGRRDEDGAKIWLEDVSFYPYRDDTPRPSAVQMFFGRLWATICPRWLRPIAQR